MLESRINFVLSIITILMVIDHCIYIKIKTMIALQFPLCSSILTFAPQFRHLVKPLRNGQFWRPKKGKRCPKKRLSPNPYWYGLFAKKRIQIGQIWPLGPNLHFTGAYRGSPPCTLSQHPNSRETGYSIDRFPDL